MKRLFATSVIAAIIGVSPSTVQGASWQARGGADQSWTLSFSCPDIDARIKWLTQTDKGLKLTELRVDGRSATALMTARFQSAISQFTVIESAKATCGFERNGGPDSFLVLALNGYSPEHAAASRKCKDEGGAFLSLLPWYVLVFKTKVEIDSTFLGTCETKSGEIYSVAATALEVLQ